jgi:DNA replication and repair protein RecF
MSLIRLDIKGIRNIQNASLVLNPKLNLIIGRNGSGKTSVLESIYFLGSARSFRSSSVEPLISNSQEDCLVRGEVESDSHRYSVGVQRNRGGSRVIRIDGEDVKRATDLASLLPILLLGSETVNLLLGPPGHRRRFLNWGLFHVEPSFPQVWEEANRCLKQRNEVLRQNGTDEELETWTRELVRYAEQLDLSRSNYMRTYDSVFQKNCGLLTDLSNISCQYYRGWSNDSSLNDLYQKDREIDRKRGFTQKGFHRADVRIRIDGEEATSFCSRGELKVLSWAMPLSQGAMLESGMSGDLLYLVDDMGAELDDQHRERICHYLESTGSQVVATGIEQHGLIVSFKAQEQKLFHVEHGNLKHEERLNDGR